MKIKIDEFIQLKISDLVSLHVILEMSFPQITFVADVTSVFTKSLLAISSVVQQLHVALIEDPSTELHIADAADMRLLHV